MPEGEHMTRKTNKPADEQKKPFDPWTATVKEAMIAGGNSVFQWQAARDIEAMRPRIEEAAKILTEKKNYGKKETQLIATAGFDVLHCTKLVMQNSLIAPEWLVYAFCQRYYPVVNCTAEGWHSERSFGKPYENKKLENRRNLRKAKLEVWRRISGIIEKHPNIKTAPNRKQGLDFFDLLTAEINKVEGLENIGKSTIKTIYYQVSKNFGKNPLTGKRKHPPIIIK